jgi:hypothetical protein
MKRAKGEEGGGKEKEFLFEENKNFKQSCAISTYKVSPFFNCPFIHPQNTQLASCPFWSPIMHK